MEDVDYTLVSKELLESAFGPDSKEIVLFMRKTKKYNRYGISQDRVFVLSTSRIYLFSSKKVNTI